MKILKIDNDIAIEFLKQNKARNYVLFIRPCDVFYGYFFNDELVGIIGADIAKKIKLNSLLVKEEFRNKGIGSCLVKYIINNYKADCYFGYVRPSSQGIFKKLGFISLQKFNNGTIKMEKK